MDDTKINEIYQGSYSSLKPSPEGYMGNYGLTMSNFGVTTDPRTANILKEVSTKLNPGQKNVEIPMLQPQVFESVPEQYLKEVNRLAKLTGINVSVHGPVVNTSGITQQGFSESERKAIERQVSLAVERSHKLDPSGNIPVTFHSGEGLPGSTFKIEKGKKVYDRLVAVDRETGKMIPLKEEKKYYPELGELGKGKVYSPEKELQMANDTSWDNSVVQIAFQKENADRILETSYEPVKRIIPKFLTGQIKPGEITKTEAELLMRTKSAMEYVKEGQKGVRALFSKAYEFGTPKQRQELEQLSKIYKEASGIKTEKQLQNLSESEEQRYLLEAYDPKKQSQALQILIDGLEKINPQMYVPIEEFATEQSSKTFANAAWNAYKKFKDKAPIVSIENPPAGFALSTGEDLKNIVEKTREKFIEKAISEGVPEGKARDQAEKLIGATWDVGHINMLRKHGFEEKDILKETEHVAPLLKHVHLSDNFGFEHTELPMGMGNVPIKEIMKKLGKKGFEARKIIEAGNWWQFMQTSPVQATLENMGSPIYSMQMAPYWNQSYGLQQGYFGGYGAMLPQRNYQTFGAGFSQLPQELGGQTPGGTGGRMGGSPME